MGSWTKEEDDRLNALVAMYGVKWSQVRGGCCVRGKRSGAEGGGRGMLMSCIAVVGRGLGGLVLWDKGRGRGEEGAR